MWETCLRTVVRVFRGKLVSSECMERWGDGWGCRVAIGRISSFMFPRLGLGAWPPLGEELSPHASACHLSGPVAGGLKWTRALGFPKLGGQGRGFVNVISAS